MHTRFWVLLLGLAIQSSLGLAATFTVTVHVVDAANKPVPRADLATFWQSNGHMNPYEGVSANESGVAVVRLDDWSEARPVMILSADRQLGDIISVSADDNGREVTATLRPTARVSGKLVCSELNMKPSWANTLVIADGFRAHVTQHATESAEFEFVLPTGKYTLKSYGTDVEDLKREVTISAEQPEYDLGQFDLKASRIAKLKGKPAPNWDITAAKGIEPKTKLADFRGKWIFLEFWGFW